MGLEVGQLVAHPSVPGIGRVGAITDREVRVDCFESVASPVVESVWVEAHECRPVRLSAQTRVFHQDPDTGAWRVGRVVGGECPAYFVRFPNVEHDVRVPEHQLRVRWERPLANPVDVLVAGAGESPYFRDARLPMLKSLTAQRAACASADALLSAAIEIFPHQVQAALTVLGDPVQRYLLADEVGLGKTIEAGLIIRQTLLDLPGGRVVLLAPSVLRRQWEAELLDKFFIDDFPNATLRISSHETPQRWSEYQGYDLLVVDEAHRLVQVERPGCSPYRELTELAHSVPRLLLLSATPVTSRATTHLGLLRLLDPDLYQWEDRAAFDSRFALRKQLATAVYALDADFESMLPTTIDEIGDRLPGDERFGDLAAEVTAHLTEDGDLIDPSARPSLVAAVEALRAHISETYRLHRRMIRHRRAQVLRDDPDSDLVPFEVRGRQVPRLLSLTSAEHHLSQEVVLTWQQYISDWLRDHDQEEAMDEYGRVLAVLASRMGGSADDLAHALRWRLEGDLQAADQARLTVEERHWLAAPALLDGEAAVLRGFDLDGRDRDCDGLVDILLPIIRSGTRVLIFCGPGSLAATLSAALGRASPDGEVGEHSARAGADSSEQAVVRWRERGGTLVVDDTAEDGLNLQHADVVVHCRLPWSPNQLEQRLGRVDRFAGAMSGAAARAARQYVVAGPGGNDDFLGAWLTLLRDGFGMFFGSVAALQEAIDQQVLPSWTAALDDGPGGLAGRTHVVQGYLAQERKDIDSMDLLESVHEVMSPGNDVAAAIATLEANWKTLQDAQIGYAGPDAAGLRFSVERPNPQEAKVVRFVRGSRALLMPPRLFARAHRTLRPTQREGAFNRNVALRIPGTRIFRRGHPFVDMLASVVDIDDRGQACTFWRYDRHHRGDPLVYFGMDYLVEADVEAALAALGLAAQARPALRRQADRLLSPFLRRVWVPADLSHAVDDPGLVMWLNRPYDPERGDVNLNQHRLNRLYDLFAGPEQFSDIAHRAESLARSELARVTDLPARCAAANQAAQRSIAVMRAQARARQAAGRLVGDADSYLVDVGIVDALIADLSRPAVRLVAATCLVRGEPETERRGH
ncbi:protein DpdE [Salinispora arenicola]|uniref:protein DpdE n=1 Tax=Salinispora arenicola TaxID=168697 RepID=UPI001E3D2C5D|nr:protein DpdE [Salinispora arenicola]